ncbi:hypothetical protein VPH35_010617 [Triticum aestivum]
MEKLPDDVVLAILVRVAGIPDLFRCAVTCTRWRRLIADASFLRRRWPEGVRHPSSLTGFFTEQRHHDPQGRQEIWSAPQPVMPLSFVPAPWSPLGPRRPYSDVVPDDQTIRAALLGSRHGLLVVRLVPRDELIDAPVRFNRLALFDPLAGTSRVLPLLDTNGHLTITGCAIITDADRCPNELVKSMYLDIINSSVIPTSNVLIIGFFQVGDLPGYKLCTFTSSESRWSTPENFYDPWERQVYAAPMQANAVVCQGTAHWLFKSASNDYVLEVSLETAHISLTELPVTLSNAGCRYSGTSLLSVNSDGKLLLLSIHNKLQSLEIWTHQGGNMSGDGTADWLRTKTIELNRPQQGWVIPMQCMCLGEMGGALLLKDNQGCVHIVDLQTGAMEMVQSWFRGVVDIAIPFEIDWPAFFMSRLVGGSIERIKFGGAILDSFGEELFGQLLLG